jgi:hypothetical protein
MALSALEREPRMEGIMVKENATGPAVKKNIEYEDELAYLL